MTKITEQECTNGAEKELMLLTKGSIKLLKQFQQKLSKALEVKTKINPQSTLTYLQDYNLIEKDLQELFEKKHDNVTTLLNAQLDIALNFLQELAETTQNSLHRANINAQDYIDNNTFTLNPSIKNKNAS